MSILLVLQPLTFLQSDAQYWSHEAPGVKCLNQEPNDERRSPLLGFGPSTISTLFVALSLLTSVYFISVLQVTPMK